MQQERNSLGMIMHEYIVSQDVAKRRDYMTTQIYRKTPEIKRFPPETGRPPMQIFNLDLVLMEKSQGIGYVDQARHTLELLRRIELIDNCDLLLDGTGVGEAVVDIYRELGMRPIPIIFTSGDLCRPVYNESSGTGLAGSGWGKMAALRTLKEMRVPKEDLVHAGSIILQQKRMRIAPQLDHLEDFRKQLAGFRGKINEKTGNLKYENATDDLHDDLVCTYLMAAWWATYSRVTEQEERMTSKRCTKGYDPMDYVLDDR